MEKKVFCQNCGKHGHFYKKCLDPKTSLGIICFKIDDIEFSILKKLFYDVLDDKFDKAVVFKKNTEIPADEKKMKQFIRYQNKIKFLLVQRKYSLGYISFLKGDWNVDDKDSILTIFKQMTRQELQYILDNIEIDKKNNDSKKFPGFDMIWNGFWKKDDNSKRNYNREYNSLKGKYQRLLENKSWNLSFYCDLYINENTNVPEWGFPKGRRLWGETNKDCAIREFNQETNIHEYCILNKLKELKEDMLGTNAERYRNLYYTAICDNNTPVEINSEKVFAHKTEIGNIGWYTYTDTLQLLPQLHIKKKELLTQIYKFIINRILKNIDYEKEI